MSFYERLNRILAEHGFDQFVEDSCRSFYGSPGLAPGVATTPDLYFPEKQVAVHCDSVQHHRSAKAKKKDDEISEHARALGIMPVRVSGKIIVHNRDKAVSEVRFIRLFGGMG